MTRSTAPGYFASAAALALSAAAPVTVVPKPLAGAPPWAPEAALEPAAAGVAVAVVLEEPQAASRPPTATAAVAPASALRQRRRGRSWLTCEHRRRAVRESAEPSARGR